MERNSAILNNNNSKFKVKTEKMNVPKYNVL